MMITYSYLLSFNGAQSQMYAALSENWTSNGLLI